MGFLVILFVLSVVGYYLIYEYLYAEQEAFFPLTYIAFVTLIVYIFGCFELLTIGYVLVILGGCMCLIFAILMSVKKKSLIALKELVNPMLLLMCIGGIWCWFLSRGIKPSHFDDFSHWLRICKMMHADLSYPRYIDCDFASYVPGTATWIFIITRITGYSPENCYFAQMLLNLACICSLTQIIKRSFPIRKKLVLYIIICVTSVFICDLDLTTYSLLVDGVLGLVASALIIYIISILPQIEKIKNWIPIALIAWLLSLIKGSGILFVLFSGLAIYLLYAIEKTKEKRVIWCYIMPVAILLLGYLLQKMYLFRSKMVYGEGVIEKAYGTASLYSSILELWDPERMSGVLKRFLYECFRLDKACGQIKVLWICLIVTGVLYVIKKRKKSEDNLLKFLFIFFPLVSVVYLVGLLATYFTFDPSEANENVLVCFYRYSGTLTIVVVFVMIYYLLTRLEIYDFDKAKEFIYGGLVLGAVCIVCVFSGFSPFYIFGFEYYHPVEVYTMDMWKYLEANYEERWDYNTDIYIMYVDVDKKSYDNYGKIRHVLVTYFRSYCCGGVDIKEENEIVEILRLIDDSGVESNIHFINNY